MNMHLNLYHFFLNNESDLWVMNFFKFYLLYDLMSARKAWSWRADQYFDQNCYSNDNYQKWFITSPDCNVRARHDARSYLDHNCSSNWISNNRIKSKTIEQSIMRARHANIKNNITWITIDYVMIIWMTKNK